MKLEIETWNLKLKLEIETRNWNFKLKLDTETWNWNLALKLDIETWHWNLKLKLELETWYWNLKLKFCTFMRPSVFFFLVLWGNFLGSRSGSKTFLEPTNVDYQFLFWKYRPIFLFLIRPTFGPFCTFWALRFFWSVGAIFGVKVRFKNIFGTYMCIQSTLVLEVPPYLFVFASAIFGAFFALFWLFWLIFGVGVRSKNFLGPTWIN